MDDSESIYYNNKLVSVYDYYPKILQAATSSVIETLNNTDNRNMVMKRLLQNTNIQWLGSWYLYRNHPLYGGKDEIQDYQVDEILSSLKNIQKPAAFTIAITRGIKYAHFTSFIVLPTGKVYTFDSGFGIYRGGEHIQDLVFSSLDKLLDNYQVFDLTVHRIPPDTDGITDPWDPICQRIGSMQCTGDPFCQIWSLLFIYTTAREGGFNFISDWEKASADERLRIIDEFILDLFVTFPELKPVANKQMRDKGYNEDVYGVLSGYYGMKGYQLT